MFEAGVSMWFSFFFSIMLLRQGLALFPRIALGEHIFIGQAELDGLRLSYIKKRWD
jgi:hypothetical protein